MTVDAMQACGLLLHAGDSLPAGAGALYQYHRHQIVPILPAGIDAANSTRVPARINALYAGPATAAAAATHQQCRDRSVSDHSQSLTSCSNLSDKGE